MKILVADDDPVSLTVLSHALRGWGHEVHAVGDGAAAWDVLRSDDPPKLAVLDWMMPGLEGPEVCRRLAALRRPVPTYAILLTANDRPHHVVAGLESGADDYVTKPFDGDELRARIRAGERLVEGQQVLADQVRDLGDALARAKRRAEMLPVCAWCRKVRTDDNEWLTVEDFFARRSDVRLSHGICPDCTGRELAGS